MSCPQIIGFFTRLFHIPSLMGGYADDIFYLLFRIMPTQMVTDGYQYNARGSLNGALRHFMEQHGILKRFCTDRKDAESFKTAKGTKRRVSVSKAPGISPHAIMRYILPYTAFLRLADVGKVLPPYTEDLHPIALTDAQFEVYQEMEQVLGEELRRAIGKGDKGMMSVVLNALLAYPEMSHEPVVVRHPYHKGNILFTAPAVIEEEEPSPKEAALIDAVLAEKKAGRKSLVYAIYTQTRDVTARMARLLSDAGVKVAILKSSITTDKRELWIANKVDEGIDVLITHPKLVETGLDLLDFPRIFFMQTGYNVFTLMQASKRSWRIGQTQPVSVTYLGYYGTAQHACLQLMQKKITVTQSASGVIPECGLDVLNPETDNIEIQLAKSILPK